MSFFKQAKFDAFAAVKETSPAIQVSHVGEIVAASMGYKTYAALLMEMREAEQNGTPHIEEADCIVLNPEAAALRLSQLVPAQVDPQETAEKMLDAIGEKNPNVYLGVKNLWEFKLQEIFIDCMTESNEVYDAQADLNAYFESNAELDNDECPNSEDLWKSKETWKIVASGSLRGSYDSDGDRMYNGETIRVTVGLEFQKAGRCGLLENPDQEIAAGIDDHWRDIDREADLQWQAEQDKEERLGRTS